MLDFAIDGRRFHEKAPLWTASIVSDPIMQATFMDSFLTTSGIQNMVQRLNLMENLQVYVMCTMAKIQCAIEVHLA